MRIKPIYEKIAKEVPGVLLCSVNTQVKYKLKILSFIIYYFNKTCPDICQVFEIESIPTFIFYENGESTEKIVGADESSLRQKINQLYQKYGKKNEIEKQEKENLSNVVSEEFQKSIIKFNIFDPSSKEIYLFKSDKFSVPISKIKEMKIFNNNELLIKFEKDNNLKNFSDIEIKEFSNFLVSIFNNNSEISLEWVPFLDLIRNLVALDKNFCNIFCENQENSLLKFIGLLKNENLIKPVRILFLRLFANIFNSNKGIEFISSNIRTMLTFFENFFNKINTDNSSLQGIAMFCYNSSLY